MGALILIDPGNSVLGTKDAPHLPDFLTDNVGTCMLILATRTDLWRSPYPAAILGEDLTQETPILLRRLQTQVRIVPGLSRCVERLQLV